MQLENVDSHKHFGIILKNDLTWTKHIHNLVLKGTKIINILKGLQYSLKRLTLEIIYFSYIRPIFEYGGIVWDGCTQADELSLEIFQLDVALIVSGTMKNTHIAKLYEETGWKTLAKRREHQN